MTNTPEIPTARPVTEPPRRATIRVHGSADYGYWIIQCDAPECRDINGRPWQQMHSRRTIEGHTIAVRNMGDHNRARHSQAAAA